MGVNFILQGAEEDISRIEKGTKILQEEWNVESQKKGTIFSDIKVNLPHNRSFFFFFYISVSLCASSKK